MTWRRTNTCASRRTSRRSSSAHLGRVQPGPDRGVKQAGFRVLVTAYMPAVLVEIGFGTNPAEARYLASSAARNARSPRRSPKRRPISGALRAPREHRGPVSATPASLSVEAAGLQFQNPIVLAAGTAGYGRELAEVMNLDRLGGLVTKAVSVEPRSGAASAACSRVQWRG